MGWTEIDPMLRKRLVKLSWCWHAGPGCPVYPLVSADKVAIEPSAAEVALRELRRVIAAANDDGGWNEEVELLDAVLS